MGRKAGEKACDLRPFVCRGIVLRGDGSGLECIGALSAFFLSLPPHSLPCATALTPTLLPPRNGSASRGGGGGKQALERVREFRSGRTSPGGGGDKAERIAGGERSSFLTRCSAGIKSGLSFSLASMFLPDGFPGSVSPDYLPYQVVVDPYTNLSLTQTNSHNARTTRLPGHS